MEILKRKSQGFVDIFFILVVLLAVIFFILILSKSWESMKAPLDTGLNSAMPTDSSVNVTDILNKTSSSTLLWDKLLPFLLIGLFGFIMLGAAAYLNHPVMIFVGIVIIVIAIMLAAIYSNVYQQIIETDEFTSTSDDFPVSKIYMQYMPQILLLMLVGIIIAVTWAKKGGGSVGL